MKSKIFGIFCLIIMIFMTTGCVRNSYVFEIDKNNNITITEVQAINLKIFKSFGQDAAKSVNTGIKEAIQKYKKEGYEANKYKEGDFSGISIAKSYNAKTMKIEDLPAPFTTLNNVPLKIKEGFFKNTYSMKFKFNSDKAMTYRDDNSAGAMLGASNQTMLMQGQDMSGPEQNYYYVDDEKRIDRVVSRKKYTDPKTGKIIEKTIYESGAESTVRYNKEGMDSMNETINSMFSAPGMSPEINLTIKIPYKAKNQNATKVISDTEYMWDLSDENVPDIMIEYEKFNIGNLLGSVFTFIALIILAVIYIKSKEVSNW